MGNEENFTTKEIVIIINDKLDGYMVRQDASPPQTGNTPTGSPWWTPAGTTAADREERPAHMCRYGLGCSLVRMMS